MTVGCTFSLLPSPSSPGAPKPIVVPAVVEESAPKGYDIKFAPPVKEPEEGRLWVCGKEGGQFICIDWDLFMQSLIGPQPGDKEV